MTDTNPEVCAISLWTLNVLSDSGERHLGETYSMLQYGQTCIDVAVMQYILFVGESRPSVESNERNLATVEVAEYLVPRLVDFGTDLEVYCASSFGGHSDGRIDTRLRSVLRHDRGTAETKYGVSPTYHQSFCDVR